MANNQGKEKKNINKEDKKWEIIRNGVQKRTAHRVVSIGNKPTFEAIFTPLGYILTMSKRLHFFGSRFLLFNYTSSSIVSYFLRRKRTLKVGLAPMETTHR